MERLRAWTVCRSCCSVHPSAAACARCAGVNVPARHVAPPPPRPPAAANDSENPTPRDRLPHGLDRVPPPADPRVLKPRRAHVYALAFACGVVAVALLAAFGYA